MKTWIASDLHINHLNILKYCPDRWCNSRKLESPDWSDVDSMNEKIISNWNSTVSPEDDVYILGDVCMGQIDKAPTYIRRLNGKKYLIAGNHDRTLRKLIKHNPENEDLFMWIRDYHSFYYGKGKQKNGIVMSHFPISHWDEMNKGAIMFHGHTHGTPTGLSGRIKDIGIDTNNLFPYNFDDLVKDMLKINVVRDHH